MVRLQDLTLNLEREFRNELRMTQEHFDVKFNALQEMSDFSQKTILRELGQQNSKINYVIAVLVAFVLKVVWDYIRDRKKWRNSPESENLGATE